MGLSAPHLKEKMLGFDSQNVILLFPTTKNMSSVHDESEEDEKYTEVDESIMDEEIAKESIEEAVTDQVPTE